MNTTCAVEQDLRRFESDMDYAESRDDAINDRALDLVLGEFSPTDKDNFDDALGEVICDDTLQIRFVLRWLSMISARPVRICSTRSTRIFMPVRCNVQRNKLTSRAASVLVAAAVSATNKKTSNTSEKS